MKLLIAISLAVMCLIVTCVFILWGVLGVKQFETLQTIPINSAVDQGRYSVRFSNPEKGRFSISLITGEYELPIRYDYDTEGLVVEVVLESQQEQRLDLRLSGYFPPFAAETHLGIILLYFSVPGDLPSNHEVTGYIKFSEGSSGFFAKYEFENILIRRVSEK